MAVLTQSYVDQVIREMANRQRPNFDPNNFDPDYRLIRKGFYVVGENYPDEQMCYQASVSKIPISQLMARDLVTAPNLSYGLRLLMELWQREPGYFRKYPEIYGGIDFTLLLAWAAHKLELADLSGEPERLLIGPGDYLLRDRTIPAMNIFAQSVGLSSNEATRIIREYQQGIYGGPKQLQVEYAKLVPDFIATVSQKGGHHWLEPLTNCGKFSQMVTLLHKMVFAYRAGGGNRFERALVEFMTNNPTDFRHCVTHADWAKELEVTEKTGYYPIVLWVPDLGLPPFMTLSTAFCFVNQRGQLVGAAACWELEMPIPEQKTRKWGVRYPGEWRKKYGKYSLKAKGIFSPLFREWVHQQVLEHNLL